MGRFVSILILLGIFQPAPHPGGVESRSLWIAKSIVIDGLPGWKRPIEPLRNGLAGLWTPGRLRTGQIDLMEFEDVAVAIEHAACPVLTHVAQQGIEPVTFGLMLRFVEMVCRCHDALLRSEHTPPARFS